MTRAFDGSRLGWVLLLAVCLLLGGCGNRQITKENVDKVQNGMSLADVEKLLGKGEQDSGDGANIAAQAGVAIEPAGGPKNVQTYIWETGNKKITIYFRDGKVASKNSAGL